MDTRQKIGLGLLLLGLILSLAYWLYPKPKAAVPVASEPTVTQQGGLGVTTSAAKPKPIATKPIPKPVTPVEEQVASNPSLKYDQLRPLSKTFSELYLSFSTAGNSENLVDSKLMMTPAFATRTDAVIKANRVQPPTGDFYGVTSRAISIEVGAIDEQAGTAAVVVDLNRQERGSGNQLRTPYNQRLTIMFVSVDGEWKVDDAILEPYKR